MATSNPFDPFLGAAGVTLLATPVYVGPAKATTPDTAGPVDGDGNPTVIPGVQVYRQVAPFPGLFDTAWHAAPYVGGFL